MLKNFAQFKQELKKAFGEGALKEYHENKCSLKFADLIVVMVASKPQKVLMACNVAPLNGTLSEVQGRQILEGQYFFKKTLGGSLGVDPKVSHIEYFLTLDLNDLEASKLKRIVLNFAKVASFWQQSLASAQAKIEDWALFSQALLV